MSSPRKPVLLVIRDGWGDNPHPEQDNCNATVLATKPCDDMLHARYPVALVKASGLDVGLPDGVMGNSEVGHENIGAGRVVNQELVRINKLFSDRLLAGNPVWKGAVERVKSRGSRLHFMGIVSDAGVHGMLEHLYGLLAQAKADGIAPDRVFIHAFTDGRDTPPASGIGYVRQVDAKCRELGIGRIATVCGRFWAMDRDNRWDRIEKAYSLLTGRKVVATAPDAAAAIQAYYDKPLSATQGGDEFVTPTAITGPDGKPIAAIGNADAVVFYNYRGDRPREITKAFVIDGFKEFDRGPKLDLYYATMTEYEAGLPVQVILSKPEKLKNILGEVVSNAGLAQFRCAETEKNPHVTFFFNNYRAEPFRGRGARMPPEPQGRHLRHAAGDVGVRGHAPRKGGDPFGQIFPRCRQLRQPGHGGAHRLASRRHQGGRGGGPWRGGAAGRCRHDGRKRRHRRRSRQLRADVGLCPQCAAHLPHAQSRGILRGR